MKKVFFSLAMLFVAGLTFAQMKNVKDARAIVNEMKPDFAKAEQMINAALTNPESKDDAETWNVAGLIQKKRSEKEMENAYLRKPYDTVQVYKSALEMCKYFFKCDELAQKPNEKGKIKNKYRKANAAAIMAERGNLINGGIYYYNQDNSQEALAYFGMYVDVAESPILADQNLVKSDTLLPQIAYYASLAANKMKDFAAMKKYATYAKEDKEFGQGAMELICTALKEQGDTEAWVAALKEGLNKYPQNTFLFSNLIDYYNNNNKFDEALAFADGMIANDPNNGLFTYVKGYLYHNMKQYDNAIKYYKEAIEKDPKLAEAYSNLGLIYCIQAQEFSEKATTDINDPKYNEDQETLRNFYVLAKPCYEDCRKVAPERKELWLSGLQRVYYLLNMEKELQEIESMM